MERSRRNHLKSIEIDEIKVDKRLRGFEQEKTIKGKSGLKRSLIGMIDE